MDRCRSDINQSIIVRELKQLGFSVIVVSPFAIGFDLIVGKNLQNWLVEVKQPGKKTHLTSHEKAIQETFGGSILIIDSTEDFLCQTSYRNTTRTT